MNLRTTQPKINHIRTDAIPSSTLADRTPGQRILGQLRAQHRTYRLQLEGGLVATITQRPHTHTRPYRLVLLTQLNSRVEQDFATLHQAERAAHRYARQLVGQAVA